MIDKNENREKDLDLPNFPQNKLIEIIYIPIFIAVFIIFRITINKLVLDLELAEKLEFVIIPSMVGLLHIMASNILSYLYNFQRIIMPSNLAPLATPKRLKILGGFVIGLSVIIFAIR